MIQSFFAELKRRKVLRIAGVYAVAAWAILQGADKLFPVLMLPGWTVTFVAVLLLIGFPLTLIITWAFELTPDGIRRTTIHDAAAPLPLRTAWLEGTLFAAILVVIGITLADYFRADAPSPALSDAAGAADTRRDAAGRRAAIPDTSVAVLPFTSFSADADSNYFADGLTEELIHGLAQITGLKVSGRTSAFYFKGRNEDLRGIGQALGVANVLEGSVRRAGDQLRITVQLVSTRDGFHLWSQTYDRKMDDIFAIQDDVSTNVAEVLQAKLIAPGRESPSRPEPDTEVYRELLVARALLRDQGPDKLTQARALLERVIEREPDNVEALSGYAKATIKLAGAYLTINFGEAAKQAKDALDRALSLEPNSVRANLVAGEVYTDLAIRTDELRYQTEAERVLARAAKLAPNDPDVATAYGTLLASMKRYEPAVDELRRAVFRDPLSRPAQYQLSIALQGLGQFAEAREKLETMIATHPGVVGPKLELGEMLMAQGQFLEAIPLVRSDHQERTTPRASFALANIYLNLGLEDAVLTTLAEMSYAPLTEPLTRVVTLNMRGDDAAALRLAQEELVRTGDALWRPFAILTALVVGDLATARRHLTELEPTLLSPNPDVSRTAPETALAAANLLTREGKDDAAKAILDQLLELNAPPVAGYDPAANKIVRAEALAQLGERDRAISELRAAKLQGFRMLWDFDNFRRLDRSPYLASVRDDPAFVALIGEMEADNRRMRERLLDNPNAPPTLADPTGVFSGARAPTLPADRAQARHPAG